VTALRPNQKETIAVVVALCVEIDIEIDIVHSVDVNSKQIKT
jgi:hypothetical protein